MKKNNLINESDLPSGAKRLLEYTDGYHLNCKSMKLISVDNKLAVWEVEVNEDTTNPFGALHGGIQFTLADNAAGSTMACHGFRSVTLNSSINYIKPATKGKVFAMPSIVHMGRSTCVMDVNLVDEQDNTISKVSITMFILGSIDDFKE